MVVVGDVSAQWGAQTTHSKKKYYNFQYIYLFLYGICNMWIPYYIYIL